MGAIKGITGRSDDREKERNCCFLLCIRRRPLDVWAAAAAVPISLYIRTVPILSGRYGNDGSSSSYTKTRFSSLSFSLSRPLKTKACFTRGGKLSVTAPLGYRSRPFFPHQFLARSGERGRFWQPPSVGSKSKFITREITAGIMGDKGNNDCNAKWGENSPRLTQFRP